MKILAVEDDPKVSKNLQQGLDEEGYDVALARSAEQAFSLLREKQFDLILLDLGLPGRDGMDVLSTLRAEKNPVPLIIITARDATGERVKGLDAGADDYIVKPFAFPELLARIRALGRRASDRGGLELSVEDLEVDLVNRSVRRAGQDVELTQREFDLLAYFLKYKDQVVSREMIAKDVWNVTSRATPVDNIIEVHVSHLRDKVDRPFDKKLIKTIRGMGYVIGSS